MVHNSIAFNNFISTYLFTFFNQIFFSVSLLWLFVILMLSFISQWLFSLSIIVIKFLWPNSLLISVSDILLFMLFNYLTSITILLFSFRVVFNYVCNYWKCKTKTCTCYSYRCSNNRSIWCNGYSTTFCR